MSYHPTYHFMYVQCIERFRDGRVRPSYMGKTEFDLDSPVAYSDIRALYITGHLAQVEIGYEDQTIHLLCPKINESEVVTGFNRWLQNGMRTEEEPSWFELQFQPRSSRPDFAPDVVGWVSIYEKVAWFMDPDIRDAFLRGEICPASL